MKSYPYPLPEYALSDFCHPATGHPLGSALRHEGEILAGNGYVALRATRGHWIHEEFPIAPADYLERFGALPWERPLVGPWRLLSDAGPVMWRRGQIGFWHGPNGQSERPWRPAPNPIWRVGDAVVRLSLLQLVARLPRVEVYTGAQDNLEPLFFRFSGGRGMIAHDPRLSNWSYHLFAPQTDCLTGERVAPATGPKPSWPLPGWPPVDKSEA